MQNIYSIQQTYQSNLYVRHKINAKPRGQPWLAELKDYLCKNLSNPKLTIPQIASDLYLSERQLFRRIKDLTDLTPNQYIVEIKLNRARQILLSGHYNTVKEVAHQVGFKRVDYFSNLFEQEYGQRPKDLLSNW